MFEEFVFQPERRAGAVVHVVGIVVFVLAGLYGIYQVSLANIGPAFLVYLLPTLAAVAFVPALAYRGYALRNGLYVLEREGLHLRWGLRQEDIPIENILWVHRPDELKTPLPLPRFYWPGAVLGVRRLVGGGEVEFLASDVERLVLVGTPGRVYALSPANPETFILAFERCIEMGSLAPIDGRSVYPTFLIARVWQALPARIVLLAGAVLSLALLAVVGAAIPRRAEVMLGFRPGIAGDAVPSVRLLLLPVLNTGFFMVDFFAGLFFFRKPESQALAYLLWSGAALTALVFLGAVLFILNASP